MFFRRRTILRLFGGSFYKSKVVLAITVILFLLGFIFSHFIISSEVLYSFMPDGDWTQNNGFNFYKATVDKPNNLDKLVSYTSKEMPGRDMSLWQDKSGRIYGAVTNYNLSQGFETIIYTGYDVHHLTPHYVNLGIRKVAEAEGREVHQIWAPEFFEDKRNQSVYLLSVANDRGQTIDKNNEIIFQHSLYISQMDMDDFISKKSWKLNLKSSKNYIDPSIFYRNGVYHLLVKDEYQKTIDYYQSNDLKSWKLIQEDYLSYTLGSPIDYTEGQFILQLDKTYYIYFDKYEGTTNFLKNQYVISTKDFKNFTKPVVVTDKNETILRHGSGILYVKKPYAIIMVLNSCGVITSLLSILFIIDDMIRWKKAHQKS